MINKSIKAPALSKNGVIGICAPSHIAKPEIYEKIIANLKGMGFRVKEADNLYKNTYGYGATAEERASDFNQLIADPEVELVFFGGGDRSNELLPYIDFELIKKNPKRICTYSDGTTILNSVHAKTDLEVYYGQMPHAYKDEPTEYDVWQFMHHLVEDDVKEHRVNSDWEILTVGRGKGKLIGGYLWNIALMQDGPYFKIDEDEDFILFIEDHEKFSEIEHVSSVLAHLEQRGLMSHARGFLFGHYSETRYPELFALLKRIGEKYQIPVAYCDDFGHGVNHAILPIGRTAVLDTEKKTLTYE